ncbi:MAG TPA: carboxypeptidase-like regulatory domain-containing protein, partial [Brevundimonas sp.]
MTRKSIQYMGAASALALAVSLACAGGVSAQVTTSTIRGSVTDDGVAEAGAAIVARDTSSGFTTRSTANANGGYVLSGLRPGTYEVTVTTADGETASDVVTIGVGQVGDLDLAVGAAVAADAGASDLGEPLQTAEETTAAATAAGGEPTEVAGVTVVARRLPEVRTPEIATN